MLRWRIVLGVVFAAALIGLLAMDHVTAPPGVWLAPVVLIIAVAASGEMIHLLAAQGLRPRAWLVYCGTLLVVASNLVPLWSDLPIDALAWPMFAITLVVIAAFVVEFPGYEDGSDAVRRVAGAVLAVAYVGLLLSFVVQMRALGGGADGVAAILALLIVVKGSDIGAYTFGRLFGRHRLAPRLSPGKTLEGVAGGMAFGCLGAWFALAVLLPWLSDMPERGVRVWQWLAFGLLVSAAGVAGDLAESLLKRQAGAKDSSTWMPGFGGVLDLLDSVLVAAPVAYACWLLGGGSVVMGRPF